MPFGQPIEPPPSQTLECGCVVLGLGGEPDEATIRYCSIHWAELSEKRRRAFKRDRRRQLLDDLFGLGLDLGMIGLIAFMAWTIVRVFLVG
jgi:hypothetical protein